MSKASVVWYGLGSLNLIIFVEILALNQKKQNKEASIVSGVALCWPVLNMAWHCIKSHLPQSLFSRINFEKPSLGANIVAGLNLVLSVAALIHAAYLRQDTAAEILVFGLLGTSFSCVFQICCSRERNQTRLNLQNYQTQSYQTLFYAQQVPRRSPSAVESPELLLDSAPEGEPNRVLPDSGIPKPKAMRPGNV